MFANLNLVILVKRILIKNGVYEHNIVKRCSMSLYPDMCLPVSHVIQVETNVALKRNLVITQKVNVYALSCGHYKVNF